jgi:hypothetical protein
MEEGQSALIYGKIKALEMHIEKIKVKWLIMENNRKEQAYLTSKQNIESVWYNSRESLNIEYP